METWERPGEEEGLRMRNINVYVFKKEEEDMEIKSSAATEQDKSVIPGW